MKYQNYSYIKKAYPQYLVLCSLFIFCAFYLASVILSFFFSLTDWHIRQPDINFIGLKNFIKLFGDTRFLASFRNTFVYACITTLLKTVLGLIVALVLNKRFRGVKFFRALFYMPCILSTLVIGYVFGFILRPDGLLNMALRTVGLNMLTRDWLGNFSTALYSVAIIETWLWTGFCAVIILAGLQAIPTEMMEASAIDGTSAFQTFLHVIVPLIRPAINIVLILNIIGGMKVFDIIMATTNGGPGLATEVMTTFVYKSQSTGAMGYAAAIGLVQFLVITIISITVNQFNRKKEVEL